MCVWGRGVEGGELCVCVCVCVYVCVVSVWVHVCA